MAKQRGSAIKLRPDWEKIKLDLMEKLVREKFKDADLSAKLLATGDALLIEGNTWGDSYWGAVKVDGKWNGQNRLGRILMQVRGVIAAAAKGRNIIV